MVAPEDTLGWQLLAQLHATTARIGEITRAISAWTAFPRDDAPAASQIAERLATALRSQRVAELSVELQWLAGLLQHPLAPLLWRESRGGYLPPERAPACLLALAEIMAKEPIVT